MFDWICRNYIIYFLIFLIAELDVGDSSKVGHYRCSWHFGPAPSTDNFDRTTSGYSTDKSACSSGDSAMITSYVNHCTKQNYVPLLACREDGTWNCQSFIAMCKTLIHTEKRLPLKRAEPLSAQDTPQQKSDLTRADLQKETKPATEYEPRMFSPDENYFTMKEMAAAVLVSFIAGATILAIVICVVWRCRHSHMNIEQAMQAAHQSAKRLAALHAITHIAHAIGGGQESVQSCHFTNPQYGQIIASRDILEDALTEHDRVYEEIFTRRKSSSKGAECIYANVDKVKKKNSVITKNMSTGDLRTIGESAEESDYGYEADNNATPQVQRRKVNNLGNIMNYCQRSPALSARHQNDDGFLRNSSPYMNGLNMHAGKKSPGPANHKVVADSEDKMDKEEMSKCDSGYMEEISEFGLETFKTGDDKRDLDGIDNGKRRLSLRM